MARAVVAGLVLLAACASKPESHAPARREELARPDAATLARIASQLDPKCADSCCLPRRDWVAQLGPPATKDDVEAATSALSSNDPRVRALAIRVLGRALGPDGVALLEPFVDDERDAGPAPTEIISQSIAPCYPVRWTRTTPSREALAAIGRVHGKRFASKDEYRSWAASHADPDASFDVWVARLQQRRPPPPELVERLRAKDEMLFARVMLHECDGHGGCGISDAELAAVVEKTLGSKLAIALLQKKDAGGQTYRSILAAGEGIFTAADVPELRALWEQHVFAYTAYTAMLGVLLSRLRPSDARSYLRELLVTGKSPRLPVAAVAIALREAARRDPIGMEKEITTWFFPNGSNAEEPDASEAIWLGLSEAEPAAAMPVFARLLAKSFDISDNRSAKAFHAAAIRVGCTNLPDSGAITVALLKNQKPEDLAAEKKRAAQGRAALIEQAKICVERRKP